MDSSPRARDQALLDAAGDGDARAFEELYDEHKAWVHALALRVTRHPADAADVTQETFLFLLGRLSGLALSGRLRTFLYPVVTHLAQAARRKGRRAGGAGDAPLALVPDRDASAVAGRDELARVLAGLPAGQREALLLRFVDGFSVEESAAALGVPAGTVKSRVHHALEALRDDPRTARYFAERFPREG